MKKNINFEEAMSSLEEIVKKLESGTLTLDESISEFENAVKLVKICNEKLEAAEQRVRILTEGQDGTVTDMPFDSSDEA
jgi:exodeoxyribonuclease VII small subunit